MGTLGKSLLVLSRNGALRIAETVGPLICRLSGSVPVPHHPAVLADALHILMALSPARDCRYWG